MSTHLGISEHTYYRWRSRYGNMKTDEARRLKELKRENQQLKRLVADQALDLSILKEVARGNALAPVTQAAGCSPRHQDLSRLHSPLLRALHASL